MTAARCGSEDTGVNENNFRTIRTICRRSDYGYTYSIWLYGGAHIHGHGRTKRDAQAAAERRRWAYIALHTDNLLRK
jgi:hypothetical protein